jgi:hypothetical protein
VIGATQIKKVTLCFSAGDQPTFSVQAPVAIVDACSASVGILIFPFQFERAAMGKVIATP